MCAWATLVTNNALHCIRGMKQSSMAPVCPLDLEVIGFITADISSGCAKLKTLSRWYFCSFPFAVLCSPESSPGRDSCVKLYVMCRRYRVWLVVLATNVYDWDLPSFLRVLNSLNTVKINGSIISNLVAVFLRYSAVSKGMWNPFAMKTISYPSIPHPPRGDVYCVWRTLMVIPPALRWAYWYMIWYIY